MAALPDLAVAGSTARLRTGDCSNNKPDGHVPAVTENGNYIVDLHFSSNLIDVCVTYLCAYVCASTYV